MDGSIKIRIGASADRSIESVFGAIEQRAKRAGSVVERQLAPSMKAGRGRGGPYRAAAVEAEKAYGDIGKAAARSAKKQITEAERVRREMERGYKQLARVAEGETRRQYQSEIRARDAFARRTSYGTLRNLSSIGHFGLRAASGIARGMGVDMSLSGGMSRAVALNSGAVGIANQERIATGQTRGAAYYEKSARDIAGGLSIDPAKVMEGMRAFAGMTGEFGASNKMIGGLARISTASGADLGQMGSAAGAVYNQTNDIDQTLAVIRSLAVQSAKGSIEMKDYATKIGVIAAPAKNFSGDIGQNIKVLSAMAQFAAPSAGGPAQAATAVRAWASNFGKGHSLKALQGAGIDVFTDKSQTQIRGPLELMHDVLMKTGGSLPKMAKLFPNARALMPLMQPLAGIYNKAGGGEAGAKAAIDELTKVMRGQLDKQVEAQNVEDYKKSQAAKAQEFQNELDKVVATMAKDLVPAMEALSPIVVKAAQSFGGLVSFLTDHVGLAIVGAIVGSIGKAAIGAALRTAIDRQLGGAGGIGGSSGAPGVGGRPGFMPNFKGGVGRGGVFGTSWGGMAGAAGVGLGLGIPLAAGIYANGISDFDKTSGGLAGITKGIANQHGSQLGFGILEAEQALKKQKDEYYGGILSAGGLWGGWGTIKDTFGMGNEAEFKGAEAELARKKAEYADYQRTGKLPPGVTAEQAAQGGNTPSLAIDETSLSGIGTATANALRGATLNVNAHITNLPGDGPLANRGDQKPTPP